VEKERMTNEGGRCGERKCVRKRKLKMRKNKEKFRKKEKEHNGTLVSYWVLHHFPASGRRAAVVWATIYCICFP